MTYSQRRNKLIPAALTHADRMVKPDIPATHEGQRATRSMENGNKWNAVFFARMEKKWGELNA